MQPDPSYEENKNSEQLLPFISSRGADPVHRLDEVSDTRNAERAPRKEPGEQDFVYEMDRINKEKNAPKMYRRETLIFVILLVGIVVLLHDSWLSTLIIKNTTILHIRSRLPQRRHGNRNIIRFAAHANASFAAIRRSGAGAF